MQEVPHKWWVQPDQILDFVHPVEEFGYVHNHWRVFKEPQISRIQVPIERSYSAGKVKGSR